MSTAKNDPGRSVRALQRLKKDLSAMLELLNQSVIQIDDAILLMEVLECIGDGDRTPVIAMANTRLLQLGERVYKLAGSRNQLANATTVVAQLVNSWEYASAGARLGMTADGSPAAPATVAQSTAAAAPVKREPRLRKLSCHPAAATIIINAFDGKGNRPMTWLAAVKEAFDLDVEIALPNRKGKIEKVPVRQDLLLGDESMLLKVVGSAVDSLHFLYTGRYPSGKEGVMPILRNVHTAVKDHYQWETIFSTYTTKWKPTAKKAVTQLLSEQ